MTKQTQDYISLKPIAERFKDVATSISDNEIKEIIKDELRTQIREQVEFGSVIGEWVDTILEDDEWVELVRKCMKDSIINKFK
jgi:CRISPR/Cas system CMR subunit Cmr4 (Cas7 group RAMP superfamily)